MLKRELNIIPAAMRNIILLIAFSGCILVSSCTKNNQSERFKILTGSTWTSDSLLVNGDDAGGQGGMLENFKGEARFNKDYTGSFGIYTGSWRFAYDETQIVITTYSLPIPLTTKIAELTISSLKITTSYPNLADPATPLNLRMTFKAK